MQTFNKECKSCLNSASEIGCSKIWMSFYWFLTVLKSIFLLPITRNWGWRRILLGGLTPRKDARTHAALTLASSWAAFWSASNLLECCFAEASSLMLLSSSLMWQTFWAQQNGRFIDLSVTGRAVCCRCCPGLPLHILLKPFGDIVGGVRSSLSFLLLPRCNAQFFFSFVQKTCSLHHLLLRLNALGFPFLQLNLNRGAFSGKLFELPFAAV